MLGFAFFLFYRKKRKAMQQSYNVDSEYSRAKDIMRDLVDSGDFAEIKEQMGDKPIEAVTECAYITDLGKQAGNLLGTAAKTVAWAAVGVKARYREADNVCYLVLSNDEIHYLLFVESEVEEHLVFDRNRIQNAVLKEVSAKDNVTRFSKVLGRKTKKLSFDLDGKPLSILFFDRISRSPGGVNTADVTKVFSGDYSKTLVDYEVMGKYFLEQLTLKYPYLNH